MATVKLTWLTELQNFAGVVIGLIMLSIGSVMFLNAGVKLYVLGYESNSYFSAENQCESQWRGGFVAKEKQENEKKMTPEAKEKCIKKAIDAEKKSYTRSKTDDMVNGGIMILVGFPLWFFHRRGNEKKEANNLVKKGKKK